MRNGATQNVTHLDKFPAGHNHTKISCDRAVACSDGFLFPIIIIMIIIMIISLFTIGWEMVNIHKNYVQTN